MMVYFVYYVYISNCKAVTFAEHIKYFGKLHGCCSGQVADKVASKLMELYTLLKLPLVGRGLYIWRYLNRVRHMVNYQLLGTI